MSRLGRHAILDGYGVDPELLNDCDRLTEILETSCVKAGATVLRTVGHEFEPQGVTVFCLLAESHATIHTYPEHGRYMADVFTCGDLDPEDAARYIRDELVGGFDVVILERPLPANC